MATIGEINYKIIQDYGTYIEYCNLYEEIIEECIKNGDDETKNLEAETLWLFISDYDNRNAYIKPKNLNPVEVLHLLMENQNLNASKLSEEIEVGKAILSQVLNYKRKFSIGLIRKLTKKFKVSSDAFMKDYVLIGELENA